MKLLKNEINMLIFLNEIDDYVSFKDICNEMIADKCTIYSILQLLKTRDLVLFDRVKGYRISKKGEKEIINIDYSTIIF